MSTRFLERGGKDRLQEGVRFEFHWSWLDKVIDDRRIGDVIRKIDVAGKVHCVACEKAIVYGSRGSVAIDDHVKRKSHKKKILALDGGTTLEGELRLFVCLFFFAWQQ